MIWYKKLNCDFNRILHHLTKLDEVECDFVWPSSPFCCVMEKRCDASTQLAWLVYSV